MPKLEQHVPQIPDGKKPRYINSGAQDAVWTNNKSHHTGVQVFHQK